MKYFRFLFSGAFMGILLIAFAISIGYATFVENDYDAVTARVVVYNAWWFEAILLLMVVNFAGMIFTKRLYVKSKLIILVIHLALIIIIIGAGVTRYIGYEGQMHIRNGHVSNKFRSTDTYFNIILNRGDKSQQLYEKVMLSPVGENLFSNTINIEGNPFAVTIEKYMPNAVQKLGTVNNGSKYISMIVGTSSGRREVYLKEGESENISGLNFIFGAAADGEGISISHRGDSLFIKSSETIVKVNMDSPQDGDSVDTGQYMPLDLMKVFSAGNVSFVVRDYVESGYLQYQPASNDSQSGVDIAQVSLNGERVFLPKDSWKEFNVNGFTAHLYLGSIPLQLPFDIQLNRFELERYPGSQSPSSFASEVTVIDEEYNNRFEYRIFMNNVLNYRGYRFFQSSYDTDEQGTILSVNHDYWGTTITYLGYALLFGSLIISVFTKKTRIQMLIKQISEVHEQRKKIGIATAILIFLLASSNSTFSQTSSGSISVDKDHIDSFGRLLSQSQEGRIEPINTVANEVLIKIHKSNRYDGLSAEEVMLGMVSNPEHWQMEPLIKVSDSGLKSILGINGDYARFLDFLDEAGQYKIKQYVDQAYIKKPALRSTFDKEIINVDERVNVLYLALNGAFLNIFPVPGHQNDKWLNPTNFHQLKNLDSVEKDMFEKYILALELGSSTGNYSDADAGLKTIKEYQKDYGSKVIPSDTKVNLEILYNKVNIFKRLFPFYFMIGILLVGFFFLETFKPLLNFRLIRNILTGILVLAFLLQTFGLGLRWYVSGHAPWSNGYESMIYISWATMLAGFLFMKKSPVTLAVTAVLAGITLLTAHMSWLNPEITNLVPVLKSYWLTIHVATITASYGFLALACMMGFLNLSLMIFRNNENQLRVNLMLSELTMIVELSLSVGLILLIIGNFLGGIWANESWGRYWGWDPKESWTLVSVIFYSFVLHIRLIPGFKNVFTFNFFSVVGFGCVLMTYFGVNYYLSGLHSYANGDPVPVPSFVYYTLLVIFGVSILAALNENKWKKSAIEAVDQR